MALTEGVPNYNSFLSSPNFGAIHEMHINRQHLSIQSSFRKKKKPENKNFSSPIKLNMRKETPTKNSKTESDIFKSTFRDM